MSFRLDKSTVLASKIRLTSFSLYKKKWKVNDMNHFKPYTHRSMQNSFKPALYAVSACIHNSNTCNHGVCNNCITVKAWARGLYQINCTGSKCCLQFFSWSCLRIWSEFCWSKFRRMMNRFFSTFFCKTTKIGSHDIFLNCYTYYVTVVHKCIPSRVLVVGGGRVTVPSPGELGGHSALN